MPLGTYRPRRNRRLPAPGLGGTVNRSYQFAQVGQTSDRTIGGAAFIPKSTSPGADVLMAAGKDTVPASAFVLFNRDSGEPIQVASFVFTGAPNFEITTPNDLPLFTSFRLVILPGQDSMTLNGGWMNLGQIIEWET